MGRRDGKIRENDDEDEDVVYAQGILDKIAGEKLERFFRPQPNVDPDVE